MSFYDTLQKKNYNTVTENGALAFNTTYNANLDLFYMAPTVEDSNKLIELFKNAYSEDKVMAIKNILFLRDIKGQGIRNNFNKITEFMVTLDPETLIKILPYFAEIGRWTDVLNLLTAEAKQFAVQSKVKTVVIDFVKTQLEHDLKSKNPSLLGKWLPNEKSKSLEKVHQAKVLIKHVFGGDAKKYRKTKKLLNEKLNTLEVKLTNSDYTFDYSKLPGKALTKYTSAFYRNDYEKYSNYLESLKKDPTELAKKSSKLYPHEIYQKAGLDISEAMWKSLPKNISNKKMIVVRDGSASMRDRIPLNRNVMYLDVASSLAIYASERLTGGFKDKFITFSDSPQLVSFSPNHTLSDKANLMRKYNEVAFGTNIDKTFDLILETSKSLEPKDYIDYILVVSDMQFNQSYEKKYSNHDRMKRKFDEAGIPIPKMIYWNLASKKVTIPSIDDDVILVSGYSAKVLDELLKGDLTYGVDFMLKLLSRYDTILNTLGVK